VAVVGLVDLAQAVPVGEEMVLIPVDKLVQLEAQILVVVVEVVLALLVVV
jgi:hypothetical protein